jgi:hypothetical protein
MFTATYAIQFILEENFLVIMALEKYKNSYTGSSIKFANANFTIGTMFQETSSDQVLL